MESQILAVNRNLQKRFVTFQTSRFVLVTHMVGQKCLEYVLRMVTFFGRTIKIMSFQVWLTMSIFMRSQIYYSELLKA